MIIVVSLETRGERHLLARSARRFLGAGLCAIEFHARLLTLKERTLCENFYSRLIFRALDDGLDSLLQILPDVHI